MRTAIAHLMSRSKREIPHYYLSTTVDLGRALDCLHERATKVEARRDQRPYPAEVLESSMENTQAFHRRRASCAHCRVIGS